MLWYTSYNMRAVVCWPKGPFFWEEGGVTHVSVPFTWSLLGLRAVIEQDLFRQRWVVGGPAVALMPGYFAGLERVSVGGAMPGVLQRVCPVATRTTVGCPRRCAFCGVRRFEPEFRELDDWPDLPVLCDNNLLAASEGHFERVVARLRRHEWCDFNQGLDARLLTAGHAELLATLRRPVVRLALDGAKEQDAWVGAVERLTAAGVRRRSLRTYVLVGFRDTPEEAWRRCLFVEAHGVLPNPQWFHPLDALERNLLTPEQGEAGWTHAARTHLMRYFYRRVGKPLAVSG